MSRLRNPAARVEPPGGGRFQIFATRENLDLLCRVTPKGHMSYVGNKVSLAISA